MDFKKKRKLVSVFVLLAVMAAVTSCRNKENRKPGTENVQMEESQNEDQVIELPFVPVEQ